MKFSPQYLVALNLLLLALAAYSAADIVDKMIAIWLMPAPKVQLSPPPPPAAREVHKELTAYAAIADRYLIGVKSEPTPIASPAQAASLTITLVGTAVRQDPYQSYCVIEDQKTRKQLVYRIGDTLEGSSASVKTIALDHVVIINGGREETYQLPAVGGTGAALMTPTGLAAALNRSSSYGGGPVSGTALGEGVQKLSETEYIVSRAEVDRAFENMSQLFTQIRAVPHFEGGKSTGFRLFAIRQGSLFDKIGLKNGDILQKINGADLSDPARALALMQELRDETELTVEIIRNRQPQTLSYQVH